jgi:hypothetical protein
VRYAAQIRALLQSQALERMAAEQEAARNAAHAQQAERINPVRQIAKADVDVKLPVDAKAAPARTPDHAAARATAQIVDIQA